VEVFANDGETVISSKIYPDPGSTGIEFFSTKGTIHIKSVRLWELRPIGLEKTMPVSGGVKTSKQ
jgi:beta-fructofuranosidase